MLSHAGVALRHPGLAVCHRRSHCPIGLALPASVVPSWTACCFLYSLISLHGLPGGRCIPFNQLPLASVKRSTQCALAGRPHTSQPHQKMPSTPIHEGFTHCRMAGCRCRASQVWVVKMHNGELTPFNVRHGVRVAMPAEDVQEKLTE